MVQDGVMVRVCAINPEMKRQIQVLCHHLHCFVVCSQIMFQCVEGQLPSLLTIDIKISSMSMLLTCYLKSESCFMQHGRFMLAYIVFTYYVINFNHHFILVNLNYNNYTENDGTCVLLRMRKLFVSYIVLI